MTENINHQTFEMNRRILRYDTAKSLLFCRDNNDSLLWVKKINDTSEIIDIQEDEKCYYISCALDDIEGEMLCIEKDSGSTVWFIPGKPFFQKLFDKYLYIIFMDTTEQHYLLKIDIDDGSKIWFHKISHDLSEYVLTKTKIELTYLSGKIERLSVTTGELIKIQE